MGATFTEALAQRVLVLDGGLSTELERRGHDLSGGLWSARLLRDAPEEIVDVHRAFLAAGADVVTTASYQASPEGFAAHGLSAADALQLIAKSVVLARRAVEAHGSGWVAGSLGPYGAMLADGSEYTGDYGPQIDVTALREFHRPRIAALSSSTIDVLACETVPSLLEVEALIEETAAVGVPVWLSLTTVTGPDGVVRTRRGEPADEAFAMAGESAAVVAVGVNCTQPSGLDVATRLAARVSGKPVVVYPNSGENWDSAGHRWTGTPVAIDPASLAVDRGLVGGCCRVGPEQIAAIAKRVRVGRC